MTTEQLAAPCRGCRHVITPGRPRLRALSMMQERQALARIEREERHIASQRPPVLLKQTPLFELYCAERSLPTDGQYLLCGSVAGEDCAVRLCEDTLSSCSRCSSGQGACVRAAPTPDVRDKILLALGQGLRLTTRRQRVGQLFQGGYEEQIDYALVETEPPTMVAISDDETLDGGLSQTVLVFGGPGSGKTYMFMRLLRQYFELSVGGLKPGGLILDPKGVMYEDVEKMLRDLGRPKEDLVVLGPSSIATSTNLLNVGGVIAPGQLGHLLADIVISAFSSVGDWGVFLYDLLESAVVILTTLDGQVTLRSVIRGVTTVRAFKADDGRSTLEPDFLHRARALVDGEQTPAHAAAVADEGFMTALRSTLLLITTTEARQVRMIVQYVRGALGAAAEDRWQALSTVGAGDDSNSMLESAFTEGKVILVSVGEGDPLVRRCVSTTAKALFQIVAGSRLHPDRTGPGWRERSVTLACDEFAQVLTEREADGLSDSSFFSRSRQYRCFNLLALQSVHMGLARVNNSSLWNAVVGNANIRIFMSVNDAETASLASGMSGKRTVMAPVESWSDAQSGRTYSQGTSTLERSAVPEIVPLQVFGRGEGVAIGRLNGRTPTVEYFRVPRCLIADVCHRGPEGSCPKGCQGLT